MIAGWNTPIVGNNHVGLIHFTFFMSSGSFVKLKYEHVIS